MNMFEIPVGDEQVSNEPVEIFQYIKDRNRNKVGIFVGVGTTGTYTIGWSRVKRPDVFDKKRGFEIAKGRAIVGSISNIPNSFKTDFEYFENRCKRYFKAC